MKRKRLSNKKSESSKKKSKAKLLKGQTSSKLCEETIVKFCKYIRRGLPIDGTCDMMGITPTSYWNWKRKGDAYLAGNNEPAEYEIYGTFVLAIKKALAQYRMKVLDRLEDPENKRWVRDMTILERRDRKSFGKRDLDGTQEEDYTPDDRYL